MHQCLAFVYYCKRERMLCIKGLLSIGVLRDMGMIVRTGIIAVMLLACIGAVSANLVLNGGFETPEIMTTAGWAIFPDEYPGLEWDVAWASDGTLGSPGIPIVANAELQNSSAIPLNPHSGYQYAELDTDWFGPGTEPNGEKANVIISQNLATASGEYTISYWQRCREADDCSLKFDWTGASSETTTGVIGDWTHHEFVRSASGPTIISFTDIGTPDSIGVLIDDISVVQNIDPGIPVPEFPTMALPAALIVGMLGAVLFIQKSKEE